MTEKIIEILKEKYQIKDNDLEKIIAETLKETIEEEINDINKGKAEIHIEKEDLSVATKMSGNPIVLISLLGTALKEIQNKHNISDKEVKRIVECSHTFTKEDM